MNAQPTPPLVSPSWLAERLGGSGILVLDIRSTESGGRAAFEAGHIPGAVHSDYAEGWRIARGGAGGLLPDPDALARLLGGLGLTPAHHVVIVSAGLAPADFSAAARVYWTLKTAGHARVSILDGGYEAWRREGLPVQPGASAPQPGAPYPVAAEGRLRAGIADIEKGGATLLDGRSRAQFEGREKSPQAARAGRLPGAAHLDHTLAFVPGTGRLKAPEELEQLYAPLPPGPVVSYCNTGHLASTNWFVLSEVLGRPDVTLYDGSMSEWTQDPNRPVATGPEDPSA